MLILKFVVLPFHGQEGGEQQYFDDLSQRRDNFSKLLEWTANKQYLESKQWQDTLMAFDFLGHMCVTFLCSYKQQLKCTPYALHCMSFIPNAWIIFDNNDKL